MNYLTSLIPKLAIFSIVIFMLLMWSGLGKNYLFDWDEGIYGRIGSEMISSGDYLSPSWNDQLWLEKPPVIGWVSALGIRLAGENELGARLLMPLFAGLTLFAVFRLGTVLNGPLMGAASMALLGYLNLFVSRARTLNTDGMLLAAIIWTLYLLSISAPPALVGVVMGLAVMVKGPAGLLAIVLAIPLLIKKSRPYLISTFYFLILTILPWHLYAYLKHGMDFVNPYLMEQVIRRATVAIEFHTESRWFYFNFLSKDLGLGVVIAALASLIFMLKNWIAKRSLGNTFLLAWWIGVPLVIFTLAKTRLSWYILPIYPGIALTIGYLLSSMAYDKKSKSVITILVIGMLVQMLWHGYQYIDYGKAASPLSDTLVVASALKKESGDDIAMLVSPSERVAQAILPESQAISSSFRYGGAPSIVWYSQKHVDFYYNYDYFVRDITTDSKYNLLIVHAADLDKVPSNFKEIKVSGDYYAFARGMAYAKR